MKNLLGMVIPSRNKHIPKLSPLSSYSRAEPAAYLRKLFAENHTVENLKNRTPHQFQSYITSLPGKWDAEMEGYIDPSCQRDLSGQFEWGHNHDFGSFYMPGLMGNRHIDILATFMSVYNAPQRDLRGKRVLDIGCWTGGTSLLLAAMGAEVFAIEEVRKYADCANYLKKAFEIENLHVENRSLYSLDSREFFDRFDMVMYFGVLYHVSDPILSLRIILNSLRDGGLCFLETRATPGKGRYCEYGIRKDRESRIGSKPSTLLGGWAWFVPSLEALSGMMIDVGFQVRKATFHMDNRALALGMRDRHVDMLRAGLSKPHIR